MDETPRTDDLPPDRDNEAGFSLRVLPTFWGLALLIALAAYTVVQTLESGPTAATARADPLAARAEPQTFEPPPFRFDYTAVEQVPFTIYLSCATQDGRDATQYQPPRGSYAVLSISQDYDEIVKFMAGRSDRYPANAYTVQTSCFRQQLESGQFPSGGSDGGAVAPAQHPRAATPQG